MNGENGTGAIKMINKIGKTINRQRSFSNDQNFQHDKRE